eukprot:m.442591 g.442591  ORF g.442591 m.442591 type:complete len:185 (+) comp18825_c0_seq1:326-880(+)
MPSWSRIFKRRSSAKRRSDAPFEAKYYGPCWTVSVDEERPQPKQIVGCLLARKEAQKKAARCALDFSKEGLVVSHPSSQKVLTSWPSTSLLACATVAHPKHQSQRLGLLKVCDPETRKLAWHLFMYVSRSADLLTDSYNTAISTTISNDKKRSVCKRKRSLEIAAWVDSVADEADPPISQSMTA